MAAQLSAAIRFGNTLAHLSFPMPALAFRCPEGSQQTLPQKHRSPGDARKGRSRMPCHETVVSRLDLPANSCSMTMEAIADERRYTKRLFSTFPRLMTTCAYISGARQIVNKLTLDTLSCDSYTPLIH